MLPPQEHTEFSVQRSAAFDALLSLIDARRNAATPILTLHIDEKSPDTLQDNATKDVWTLFRNGIGHLKNGAPDGGPGSIAEAVSRISLRASPLAAALGIAPPQFEQVLLSVDYTDGRDAAFSLARHLVEAAESDFPHSRQIIQQKILDEKPPVEELKEQMALSFNVLAETYVRVCGAFKDALDASPRK